MAVTARFYVAEVHKYPTRSDGWADPVPMGKVILRAAIRGEENKAWASATPVGLIDLTVKGDALPWFEDRLGADLHITFDDVPRPAPQSEPLEA